MCGLPEISSLWWFQRSTNHTSVQSISNGFMKGPTPFYFLQSMSGRQIAMIAGELRPWSIDIWLSTLLRWRSKGGSAWRHKNCRVDLLASVGKSAETRSITHIPTIYCFHHLIWMFSQFNRLVPSTWKMYFRNFILECHLIWGNCSQFVFNST